MARKLLLFLSTEMNAPGSGLRDRILGEHPGVLSHIEETGGESPLHLLYDPRVPICCTHAHLFAHYKAHLANLNLKKSLALDDDGGLMRGEAVEFELDTETVIQKLRRQMLTHIIENDFSLESIIEFTGNTEDPLNLAAAPGESVQAWLERALDILETAKTISAQRSGSTTVLGGLCKQFRESMLEELIGEMLGGSLSIPPCRCDPTSLEPVK
jgi:hypothetical protein